MTMTSYEPSPGRRCHATRDQSHAHVRWENLPKGGHSSFGDAIYPNIHPYTWRNANSST